MNTRLVIQGHKLSQRLRVLPVAVFLLAAILVQPSHASSWDNELRCCLTIDDQKNAFLITLTTPNLSKAEMRLTHANGTTAGFDAGRKQYSKPTADVIYASTTPNAAAIDSREWHQGRNKQFVLRNLIEGDYRLDVIGVRSGRYFLSFYPAGYGNSRGSVFINGKTGTEIKQGEVHHYRFPGRFDDVMDGGIPLSSPTRFRVKREQ